MESLSVDSNQKTKRVAPSAILCNVRNSDWSQSGSDSLFPPIYGFD